MATPKASTEDAKTYYAGADADALDVEVARGIAANVVASLSNIPEEPDAEYDAAARLGELTVGRFLWATQGGTLSAKSISSVNSKTYSKLAEVQSLVSAALGGYYRPPGGSSESSNVALVSRMRW